MSGCGLVVGAALGDCVHVAGLLHFLRLAEEEGYETRFLGSAQPVAAVAEALSRLQPDLLGLSYRLSPEAARPLFEELGRAVSGRGLGRIRLVFGGTGPVCEAAEKSGLFAAVFSSASTPEDIRAFLRGAAKGDNGPAAGIHPATLVERIEAARPYPIYRHHFGQPTLAATIEGCALLAESGVIDVISIGPDQNTQERFFHPDEIDESQSGAGGVPLRTADDFRVLWSASRRGNHPLMRCYSGTRDILRMARMLRETINNAWCAVPLFWYNVLDGRSDRALRDSIRENMNVVAWHAEQGVPVEVNEAHHWSLREAPDAVAVATAFLAAYNAKVRGVRHYVSQYMFNTPAGTWHDMDLGKMLAKIELIEALHDEGFTTYREARAGLASFPADLLQAKGHLAGSAYLQMALAPHIMHVVGYSEADHAARPDEIIESVRICRGVAVAVARGGMPDMRAAAAVRERKEELVAEARVLLRGVQELGGPGVDDPWADPETLARSVETGLLDAPHLIGNPAACGRVRTQITKGRCVAIDPGTGRPISERERVARVLDRQARAGTGR